MRASAKNEILRCDHLWKALFSYILLSKVTDGFKELGEDLKLQLPPQGVMEKIEKIISASPKKKELERLQNLSDQGLVSFKTKLPKKKWPVLIGEINTSLNRCNFVKSESPSLNKGILIGG